jgi:hypothetical protein
MKRSTLAGLTILAAALGFSGISHAEPLDSSKTLVCDIVHASQCDAVAECRGVEADQIDLPPVVLIDFEQGRIASEDGQRTSPIAATETSEDVLILQGHQNGRGWVIVIERATGHLSASLAETAGSFVLAGACSPQ